MAKKKPDLSEFEGIEELEKLRGVNARLEVRLREAKQRNEGLREAIREGMWLALREFGPLPLVQAPAPDRRRGKPEVALWHLTDWQGHKVTASYNRHVMRERVIRFCDKAEHLTDLHRAAQPVDEAVVMFGGDMAEGLFNYPSQPFEVDETLFGQFAHTGRLEAEVVRRALAIYRKVHVVTEWGNHGRLGSKRAAVPPSDNLDRMIHELARASLAHPTTGNLPKRLTWQESEDDEQRVTIGKYRALLIHGDEFGRNGFASPNTILQRVVAWKSGAYPWQFQDCYMGHYHNHGENALPDGKGALYRTGAPETDNRYARTHMAASATPSQRLHFIDPRKGRVTAVYKVFLDS